MKEDYFKALLDGKRGNRVTDDVPKPEETSTSDNDSFEKFMAKYQAGIIGKIDLKEENIPDVGKSIGIENQGIGNLEEELAEEPEFHSTLLTPDSDYDPNEGLEQQGISILESYGGFTDPQLSGYDTQDESEGPDVGYHGPSTNGNGNYLL